jgi:hypothetical protein
MERRLLKNWLSLNNISANRGKLLLLLIGFIYIPVFAQINYVSNPSFETTVACTNPNFIYKAKYWNSIDSVQTLCGGLHYHTCYPNIPYNGIGRFQFPRTGNGFIRSTFYYPSGRTYPKNRLSTTLIAGKTYCVKMYVNLQNNSPNSLSDEIAIYFSDSSVDTISKCGIPLNYLIPQIKNSPGNFITDTLGWVEVSGTFTATGTEKYLVIGNFKTDAATTPSVTWNPPSNWSEYNIDDVSVIDFNLSAYAGPDKNIFLGDSAFIGRPPEIGLDCTWSTGTVTVGDSAGIWVKPPLGTYTYVVTQNICGNIKTDTVIVNVGPSGISENTFFTNGISLYPQPAKDLLTISLNYFYEPTVEIKITDVAGKMIRNENLAVKNGKTGFNTSEFPDGVYLLQIISKNQIAQKRLIITK